MLEDVNCPIKRPANPGIYNENVAARDINRRWVGCLTTDATAPDPLRALRAVRLAARFGFRMNEAAVSAIRSQLQGPGHIARERVAPELEKAYAQLQTPSAYFQLLAALGALEFLFAPLAALRTIPAAPANSRHGLCSAFEHTMAAIDRAKANGYSFGIFLAVLCHDFGKATTPEDILPHHYGHEKRSEAIAKEWFQQNRFRASDAEFAVIFARDHMKVHVLEEMRPAKLIRFVGAIPHKYREDFFNAGDCDTPMSERQWQIVRALQKVLAEGGDTGRRDRDHSPRSSDVQRQDVEIYGKFIAEVE